MFNEYHGMLSDEFFDALNSIVQDAGFDYVAFLLGDGQ